ncbi:hypothetical protein NT2_01_04590 [Caenibius tardaugens NBRC 16725]|uniref:Pili assembly chaperone N-terminal domain-containing protein n=1 Tax=Caenibius tardaugens NBRC 16725 TaxID=1219035 RepID=U2YI30_9SPHN|nr:fimbria/pilus periplasmic chaperone [Caenibius tardaugens]AZI37080.1 molecular chaperone [Caenibius tardaugens NBRC 16725]GAD47687.1 hypothetical protein NT2_01_04590 [Caenibius tardaugens NBRC 16725]
MHVALRLLAIVAGIATALGTASAAAAQSVNTMVIWPIDPVIAYKERAAALWLENPGKKPLLMQVRIFGWNQDGGEDHFTEQKEVTGTPPLIRIEPGQRQLVRLTRLVMPEPGRERAYRVIVDEIPLPDAPSDGVTPSGSAKPKQAGAAIQFRMRYSVPLYVYGEGLGHKPDKSQAIARSQMEWRVIQANGKPVLEIRNLAPVHGKINSVSVRHADGSTSKLNPVVGHILAGSVMRWTIDKPLSDTAVIEASVNGAAPAVLAHWSH